MMGFRMANFKWQIKRWHVSAFFGIFLIVIFFFGGNLIGRDVGGAYPRVGVAFADDDDDEDKDDEDEDHEDEDDKDEDRKKKKKTISVTRYEVRQVSRVVEVLAPEYGRDTDGDLLVDGIDPNPLVHQKEYFTDTDGDSVPDAFDRHHDDDDFAYFEEEDSDQNGIIDAYEQLAER